MESMAPQPLMKAKNSISKPVPLPVLSLLSARAPHPRYSSALQKCVNNICSAPHLELAISMNQSLEASMVLCRCL